MAAAPSALLQTPTRATTDPDTRAWLTEAVRRHADLVYSAAARRVGDPHLAEDVTQAVFLILAKRPAAAARSERRTGSLAGWLLKTTRYAAANALKQQRRREYHERQAMTHATHTGRGPAGVGGSGAAMASSDPSEVLAWREIAPLLDDALLSLGAADRAVLLLRYFEHKSPGDIAAALGVTEAAARQRLSRGLKRLRASLDRRGVSIPTGALAALLMAHAVKAAPAGLLPACLAAITGATAVLSSGTAAGLIAKGTLTMMNTVKLTTAGALLLATGATVGLLTLTYGATGNGTAVATTPASQSNGAAADPVTQPSRAGTGSIVLEGEIPPWPPALARPLETPLTFDEAPLAEVIAALRERSGLPIFTDWRALELEGVSRTTPITIDLAAGVSMERALTLVLQAANAGFASIEYDWDEGVLMISTAEELARHIRTMVIDLRPVAGVAAGEQVPEPVVDQVIRAIVESVHSDQWRSQGGTVGSIQEVQGRLVVTATPRMLRDVLALLERLAAQ